MDWTFEKVRKSFSGRLIGSRAMKKAICKSVLFLPSKIIEYVTNNVWFISTPQDAWAFTFRGSDIKGQYLIFLSEELFGQPGKKVSYTILHELGHALYKHKNSMGYLQSHREIDKQETEADHFAKRFI